MSIIRRATFPQFNTGSTGYGGIFSESVFSNASGEAVNELSAYGVSTVLGSVSLLADTTASMTLRAYKVSNGERVLVDLPAVIAEPDSETNTYEFIHQFVSSMALHGNSFTFLTRDRYNEVIGMLNLHPYQMQVMPDPARSGRMYRHMGTLIDPDLMLHQRWFTPPQSLIGISPLNQNRNLVGLSLAVDRSLAQFYGEGGTPSSVISVQGKLTPDNAKLIRDTWETTHRRHRKPAVISDGATWTPITTSAADSQVMAFREQLIRDIARVFRIPSHLIGASGDNQTYQNVEQASLNFLTHTMQPWLRRIELALSKILPEGIYVEFDTSSLIRLDALTRARVDQLKVAMGARNPNEVRIDDGKDPYKGGDVFHQSLMGKPLAGGEFAPLGDGPTPTILNDGTINSNSAHMDREILSTRFNVAAPEIRVEAPNVNVSPAQIDVASPNVTVEAPNITVEAPAVTINNLTPRSRVTRTVIRDKDGRIESIIDDISEEGDK